MCESRTSPSRLLCLAGMIGLATQAQWAEQRGEMKYTRYDASKAETKISGRRISRKQNGSSSLHTHTHTKTPKRHKWTVLKQAWQRDPGCLSFQPPLSRDTVTLVSHSYRYEFFHCYQPTTLLSQSWMNGTHGNRCNSLLRARYLAESHNVPVIEVELLKRPHTKSWKFSDKHEKRSCDEKHWAARGPRRPKQQPSALLCLSLHVYYICHLCYVIIH